MVYWKTMIIISLRLILAQKNNNNNNNIQYMQRVNIYSVLQNLCDSLWHAGYQ